MEERHRKAVIEELKAALGELESEHGLERFVEGHGLQSREFVFEWREPGLEMEFRLPYARVLSEGVEQEADAARIGGACRLAVLLLWAKGEGGGLAEGEAGLAVYSDEDGDGYEIYGPSGVVMDSGTDWEPLIARLKGAGADVATGFQIIWP